MKYKRIVALILSCMMAISAPLVTLADGNGDGTGGYPTYRPVNASKTNKGVRPSWGVRVTLASSAPFLEHGVTDLPSNPTQADLDAQFDMAWRTAEDRYIEPGSGGINYFTGSRPDRGTGDAVNMGYSIVGSYGQEMLDKKYINKNLNQMAWNCYYTEPGAPTDRPTTGGFEYKSDLFNVVFGDAAIASAGNPGGWLDNVRTTAGHAPGDAYYKGILQQVIVNDGSYIGENMNTFTWASNADVSAMGSPSQKVMWSKLGYITALMQICWAAQDIGDTDTYKVMANRIAAWAQTGYSDSTLMPIIMMEATSQVSWDGTTTGAWCMMTLPMVAQISYNTAMASQLYAPWPEEAKGSTDEAMRIFSTGMAPETFRKCQLEQGLGYSSINGVNVPASGGTWLGRNFYRNLRPMKGNDSLVGYIHNWTYFTSDSPGNNGNPTGTSADGSFTWKLNPKGIHDVTPDTEVNASSTVYDINMSQSGYNKNNIDKWTSMVNGDNSDANKIRINIYRISQSVPKGEKAGEFTRGQVRNSGSDTGSGFITCFNQNSLSQKLSHREIS